MGGAMKTTILAYLIALGGVVLIVLGLWGLYIRIGLIGPGAGLAAAAPDLGVDSAFS
jgi:hypothetical protein